MFSLFNDLYPQLEAVFSIKRNAGNRAAPGGDASVFAVSLTHIRHRYGDGLLVLSFPAAFSGTYRWICSASDGSAISMQSVYCSACA
jgi:hypothetical protein